VNLFEESNFIELDGEKKGNKSLMHLLCSFINIRLVV
jgi:hypothetical protein